MSLPVVLYEDNHLLAVNKPACMLSQGDQTGDQSLIDWAKDYLKKKYEKPGNVFCGLVHRIDRPVSGVVILAKTSKSLERMNKLFQDRLIRKDYLAIVENQPIEQNNTLKHYLMKDTSRNITKAYSKIKDGASYAELSYKVSAQGEDCSLLSVLPVTGRPHQIRAQLSSIGCPIIGDLKYGARNALPDASIALHAWSISFEHPTKKEPIHIFAPVPKSKHWQYFLPYLIEE